MQDNMSEGLTINMRPKKTGDLNKYILQLEDYCDKLEQDVKYYQIVKANIKIEKK